MLLKIFLWTIFKRNTRAKLVRDGNDYDMVPNMEILCDSIISLASNANVN